MSSVSLHQDFVRVSAVAYRGLCVLHRYMSFPLHHFEQLEAL